MSDVWIYVWSTEITWVAGTYTKVLRLFCSNSMKWRSQIFRTNVTRFGIILIIIIWYFIYNSQWPVVYQSFWLLIYCFFSFYFYLPINYLYNIILFAFATGSMWKKSLIGDQNSFPIFFIIIIYFWLQIFHFTLHVSNLFFELLHFFSDTHLFFFENLRKC